MDNNRIIKTAIPFLAVFVLSLFVAGNEYIKQISAPTNAADEDISIQLVNTAAPTEPESEWRWNAAVYINNYFQQPIQGTYSVDWCNATFAEQATPESCKPSSHPEDFNDTIAEGTFTIDSRQTTIGITHPSIDCGRVQVNFVRDEETLVSEVLDTGIMCDAPGLVGLNAFESGGDELDIVINFAKTLLSWGTEDVEEISQPNTPDDPSNPDPTPTGPQEEPENPEDLPKEDKNSPIYSAYRLFTYVVGECGGRLNFSSLDCLNKSNYDFKNESIAKKSLENDTKSVYETYQIEATQCVAGARAFMVADRGYYIPGVPGCARIMASEQYWGQSDLTWIQNDGVNRPKQGDLAIWDYGTYTDKNGQSQRSCGHVAYVYDVKKTKFNTYDVNKDFAGGFSIHSHDISIPSLKGWLRKQ